MRYAIFSDIQGNRTAWNVVAEDLRRQGVETSVCLGDLVGAGPMPQQVLRSVRDTTDQIILGDCDATVAGLRDDSSLGAGMQQAIAWTRDQLDPESLEFLAAVPPVIKTEDLLFTHAATQVASRFDAIDTIEKAQANFAAADQRLIFVGHGHHRAVFMLNEDGTVNELPPQDYQLVEGKRYIINVGSVGIPPGANDFRARYAIYDSETGLLTFRLVPFPAEACRNDWKAAGLLLPLWLSQGLGTLPSGAPPDGPVPPGGVPAPAPVAPVDPNAPGPSRLPLVALLSGAVLLTITVVVLAGVFIASKLRHDGTATVVENNPTTPHPEPAPPEPPDEPDPPEPDPNGKDMATTDPPEPKPKPEPEPTPDPPVVADVPEPKPKPAPAPEPAPNPPPVGPPPIPPEPADAASATPLTQGLIFYAPLDEPGDEFTSRDLVGGRDLDVSGGLPGSLGRVGFAVALEKENSSDAIVSEVQPLPAMKAVTMSFWIKRPDPTGDDADATTPPAKEPPMNLVSLKGFCDVRLENNQVVANMDRKGTAAQVAFPTDDDWHHVLVENGGGKTTIWIDHRSQATPVDEKLTAPPKAGVAVQIGSKNAHFHVDEVAIWNRKFTTSERQILYRHGRLDKPVLTPPTVVAHWKFDDKASSRILADSTGDHPLGAFRSWSGQPAIAPNPVPLTEATNPQAARVWQLSERPEDAGSFQMHKDAAFTYEGWMQLSPGSTVLLGGVIPDAGEDAGGGWRLEARPGEGVTGSLVFTYQIGPVTVEASAKDIPIYFGRPHHFAAVWNPLATPTHGTMDLHLDNKVMATTSLPLSDLGDPSDAPFRILATKLPVVLDEVRFTTGALKPAEFLTTGITPAARDPAVADAPDAPPPDETPMERSAREARERREKEDEEREARRREEEAKRNRSLQ